MPGNKKTSIWTDPDDAPELTDEVFERAGLKDGDCVLRPAQGTLTKRGRPQLENPKLRVTLRLDSDLINRLRESGPGWQSRINEILRKAV
ncbi:BrnA antitoxin family protein [soil metagenome]